MSKITFIEPDGRERVVEAVNGLTVMENAMRNGVEGISASCGGCCTCATCHVIVAPEWQAVAGNASQDEADILAFASSRRQSGSRLSCQIRMSNLLDGIVLRVPKSF